ncbi:hypothetical protein PHYSODRAFT_479097 [Phytophthora sojae]|uniref:Uncharacterized protein n=1 Tax=Phytophthora sojae (strain P6497) TaxID=1094619 RepID=G4YYG0_PHYSP|nr:hypothetical protein PHYSODRAFT_479097 [Phytophthora sojae]EGZ23903.1 hypothetical protein PHYSODRAFT_479097 [Phytophthora sojae]|eukprot:XP_009519191.1 hypothetical protein PHYSODRAFT_479097 [Phytophthora sojae]
MEKLNPIVLGKQPSRKTPFQPAHALKYGVEIVLRDKTGVVCSVECLFCRYFGREEAVASKRKRTQNVRTYKPPYRPQSYIEHNQTAHPEKWSEYEGLSDADKVDFFKDRTPPKKNQLSAHFDKESACVRFSFPAEIVEVLLGNLFFNAEDEEATVATALRAFGPNLDEKYSVVIKTPLRFTLAVQHLSVGLSFRQTAEVIR